MKEKYPLLVKDPKENEVTIESENENTMVENEERVFSKHPSWFWLKSRSPIYQLVFNDASPPCPEMTNSEFIHMSPMSRWKLYGIFPWKSLIHLALIVFFTVQIILAHSSTFYKGDIRKAIDQALIKKTTQAKFFNQKIRGKYSSPDDILSDMEIISTNYFELENQLLGIFAQTSNFNSSINRPVIAVLRYEKPLTISLLKDLNTIATKKDVYYPSKDRPLGGISLCGNMKVKVQENSTSCNSIKRSFFLSLVELSSFYSIRTHIIGLKSRIECFDWTINFQYKYMQHRSTLGLNSLYDVKYCDGFKGKVSYRFLDFCIYFLAVLSLILSIRTLFITPFWFCYLYSKHDRKFSKKSLWEKFVFANKIPASSKSRPWHFLTVCGCISTIIYTILKHQIVPVFSSWNEAERMWFGVSALFNYLSLPYYLYNVILSKQYSTIVGTLFIAFPHIIRVIVCFIPVMVVYVGVGTILFGNLTDRFSSLGNSWITLFSVANGDEIRATIDSLFNVNSAIGSLGAVYVISYISIFIYVVLTIIISIMERTYSDIALRKTGMEQNKQGIAECVDDFLYKSSTISLPHVKK